MADDLTSDEGDLTPQLSPLQKHERIELEKAFREVCASASGKRVLFWLLEQSAIYADAFAGEHTASTNYTLGRQSVGRRVIVKLDEIDPQLYPQLLRDVAEIRSTDAAAAKAFAKTKGENE